MYNYTMDPLGDAVITLNNPNAPFAVWQPATISTEPIPASEPTPDIAPESDSESTLEIALELDLDSSPDENLPIPEPENAEPGTQLVEPVTFLVSSRHLILASPVFKAMLTGVWSEGIKNDNGLLQISAEDWDVEALAIVMNVLHSHYSQVPRTLTLEMLAKAAVIVDYYQVHEALQVMTSLWIEPLKESISLPETLERKHLLWMAVAWVLREANIFEVVTETAILQSRRDTEFPPDLPIPEAFISMVSVRLHELVVVEQHTNST